MNPCGGAGALNAIHDAVTLANWMSTLRFADVPAMEKIFKEYHKERYPIAKESFHSSQLFSKNLGKNLTATIIRTVMKRLPPWLWKRIQLKLIAARPQLSFIPQVKDQGTVKPTYQHSLHMTLPILKNLTENPAIVATESSASVIV
ncbi:hypothetical protein BGZ52_008851 [Haplosporangium bisporale]|nr:hypothetical protein BGZ52_008851 [Haplosporangium bisporale]